MAIYERLAELEHDTEKRAVERILALRRALEEQVPRRSRHQLLVATWNIREFDGPSYGDRGLEPLCYIAEIISHFDLVAVAELRADLAALDRLMGLLGPRWHHIVTDVTKGSAGNDERLAVLYDTETVTFGGLSGELVVPPLETRGEHGEKVEVPVAQLARTPLIAGFTSEWVRFEVGVLHVRWGEGRQAPAEELRTLVAQVVSRDESTEWARDLILLGDFNIGSPDDTVWQALRDLGWMIPPDFAAGIKGSNVAQDKYYDQIALKPREHSFELSVPASGPPAGVVDFFDVVYREEDFEAYVPDMKAFKPDAKQSNFTFDSHGRRRTEEQQRAWYAEWRTYQMSDHLPLWVSLRTDYAEDFLNQELAGL